MISSTPTPYFTWAKTNGPVPRIFKVSRTITFRSAAHGFGQIGFVDHQQVGLGDARPAFARNLVAAGHVNDLDGVIRPVPG